MYPLLVSVSVTVIIVARLPSLTVRVATLVRPALYMDIHHVAIQAGLCHEAFTTVRTEKPLVGVLLMCCGQMELEALDSFPTELAGLRVVNSEVVLSLVPFKDEDLITVQAG